MLKKQCIAMLLAGGQGSRLGILTANMAKPAIPYGGKYRIIDFPLSNCANSGIDVVGVLTQYQPLELNAYIGSGSPWDLDLAHGGVYVLPPYVKGKQGEWYSGTANAIYQNVAFIEQFQPEYVLILSGDHIYKMDYNAMLQYHIRNDADVTIAVREVPWEEAPRFGIMNTGADNVIEEFEEKPAKPRNNKASMGVYMFTWEKLRKYLAEDAQRPNSSNDFGKNIIPAAVENAKSIAYPFLNSLGEPAYWRDVGSLYSYWKANIELCDIEPELNLYERDWPIWTYQAQSPPAKFAFDDDTRRGQAIDSLVAGGCIISGAKVKRSVIFFNTQIETGTYIRESVILPKVRVGRNCKLLRCIVDKGTVIPDNFQVGVDLEEDRKRFLVTDEGIVLVTPGMMNQRLHYERD